MNLGIVYFHGFDELYEHARQFIIDKNFSYEIRKEEFGLLGIA